MSLAELNVDVGVAFNRKEIKNHGERGWLIGEEIRGRRVLVVDDVITAGTAIKDAQNIISQAGGELVGIVVALDRQELAEGGATALETASQQLKVPIVSIAALSDVITYLEEEDPRGDIQIQLRNYQRQYCRIN